MARINVHTTLFASLLLRKPTKSWQTRSLILKTNSKNLQIQQKKENTSAHVSDMLKNKKRTCPWLGLIG